MWLRAQLALLHAFTGGYVRVVSRTGGRRLCSSSCNRRSRLRLQKALPAYAQRARSMLQCTGIGKWHPPAASSPSAPPPWWLRPGSRQQDPITSANTSTCTRFAHCVRHTAAIRTRRLGGTGCRRAGDHHRVGRRPQRRVPDRFQGMCERLSSQQVRSRPQATRGQNPSAAKP